MQMCLICVSVLKKSDFKSDFRLLKRVAFFYFKKSDFISLISIQTPIYWGLLGACVNMLYVYDANVIISLPIYVRSFINDIK